MSQDQNMVIGLLETMRQQEQDKDRKDALRQAIDALELVNDVDHASCKLHQDYLDDVRGLAKSLEEEIKRGEITDRDQLMDRMHEDCDGAQRVIYTHQAKLALVYSDYSDAYEEEYGHDMPNWSQLAYCAFYRDVSERIEEPEECFACGSQYGTVEHEAEMYCSDCFSELKEEDDDDE